MAHVSLEVVAGTPTQVGVTYPMRHNVKRMRIISKTKAAKIPKMRNKAA